MVREKPVDIQMKMSRKNWIDMLPDIDILVNLDGERKLCMFGEKENKKLNLLHGKNVFYIDYLDI
jgi:hypothetical protein